MSKFFKSIVVASFVLALPMTANAENKSQIVVNEQGVRTAVVEFGDLNLATAAGQDALSSRIRSAVREVCGVTTARQSLAEMTSVRSCTATASREAFASVERESQIRLAVNR